MAGFGENEVSPASDRPRRTIDAVLVRYLRSTPMKAHAFSARAAKMANVPPVAKRPGQASTPAPVGGEWPR